jgi:parallel beta-helix repeat protein
MDGTREHPFRTITGALAVTKINEAIFVEAGTYDDVTGGESFPLLLKAGTALVGLGPNHSTALDASALSFGGINGGSLAFVYGLRIIVCDATGIDDLGLPMSIHNVLIDDSGCGGPGALDGIILAADSTVSNVTVNNPWGSGITVNAGNPVISNSTLTGGAFTFYGIYVGGGAPVISNNIITNSSSGTGIFISNVSPTVTNNDVHNNATGIFVSGSTAIPLVTGNSIYCNTDIDMNVDPSVIGFIATLNSWDHDATTPTKGPTSATGVLCVGGVDICLGGGITFVPISAAVSNGCP